MEDGKRGERKRRGRKMRSSRTYQNIRRVSIVREMFGLQLDTSSAIGKEEEEACEIINELK